jgi:hypothetical protein
MKVSGTSIIMTFSRVVGGGVGMQVSQQAFIGTALLAPDVSLGYLGTPLNTTGLWVVAPVLFVATGMPVGYSDSYVFYPPNSAMDSIFGITADGLALDTGTATNAGILTLECLGKAWGINAFANKAVIIVSGAGAGYTRRIISNTANTLTIGTMWDTTPNITSIFYIVDEVYRTGNNYQNYLALREYI